MENYVLSCCSTADLSREHLKRRDIVFVSFHFRLDGREYLDDLGQSISLDDFYARMAAGAMTATSQVNTEEYIAHFRPYLEAGRDVLHVCLSSGLSGSMNSALLAQDILREEFPERKLLILDSLSASSGYGLLMDTLADLRDEGRTIEELAAWCQSHVQHLQHWFFSTDLQYFVRGGRISKTAAAIGTVLSLCPLMHVDREGKLVPVKKIRTKARAIVESVHTMLEYCEEGSAYSGKCFISHSACRVDADRLAAQIEAAFPALHGHIRIFDIGTSVGSHTGPGTVALFFWGRQR